MDSLLVVEGRRQGMAGAEGIERGLPVERAVVSGARPAGQLQSQDALSTRWESCDGVDEVASVTAQRESVLLDLEQPRRRVAANPTLQEPLPLSGVRADDGVVTFPLLDQCLLVPCQYSACRLVTLRISSGAIAAGHICSR